MAEGPGKYDDLCSLVRIGSEGKVVLVMVIEGNKGSGFSVQADKELAPGAIADLMMNLARVIKKNEA